MSRICVTEANITTRQQYKVTEVWRRCNLPVLCPIQRLIAGESTLPIAYLWSQMTLQVWVSYIHIYTYIYTGRSWIIIVPADVLAPYGARSSAGTVLISKLNMNCSFLLAIDHTKYVFFADQTS